MIQTALNQLDILSDPNQIPHYLEVDIHPLIIARAKQFLNHLTLPDGWRVGKPWAYYTGEIVLVVGYYSKYSVSKNPRADKLVELTIGLEKAKIYIEEFVSATNEELEDNRNMKELGEAISTLISVL